MDPFGHLVKPMDIFPQDCLGMHKTKHTEAPKLRYNYQNNKILVHYSNIYSPVLIHLITKSSGRSISCHNIKVVRSINDFFEKFAIIVL